ncbi:hypothetical protein D3C87_832430 [compost metagenome]
MPAQALSARAISPSQAVWKMPAGPMAVTASTMAPVWSNTGAAMALTPSITSPSERLMPWSRTSWHWRSKSLHEGSGCTGGMPAGGAGSAAPLRCFWRWRSSSSCARTTAGSR